MKCLFVELPLVNKGPVPFYQEVIAPARKNIRTIYKQRASGPLQDISCSDDQYVYSIGLLLLASAVRESGFEAKYIQLRQCDITSISALKRKFDGGTPVKSVVCLSPTTPQISMALNVAKKLKQISEGFHIIIGGAHASIVPKSLLEHAWIDAVVVGPGEDSLVNYCKFVLKGKCKKSQAGLLLQSEDEIDKLYDKPTERSPSTKLAAALDLLPKARFKPYTMCSWGCRFSCSFCSEGARFKKYALRDPNAVKQELKELSQRCSDTQVHIADSCFPLAPQHKDYLKVFLDSAFENFEINLRVDLDWNADLLKTAVKCGVNSICVGIETVDKSILKSMGKTFSRKKLFKNLFNARECGIETIKAYWLLGHPGESVKSMLNSIESIWEFMNNGLIDDVFVKCFVPYPGTIKQGVLMESSGEICSTGWNNFHRRTFPPVYDHNNLYGIELYSGWLLAEAIRTAALTRKFGLRTSLKDWCMQWHESHC